MDDSDPIEAPEVRDPELKHEAVIRLLTEHHSALYRYILTFVPSEEDARDILQETCVDLFRRSGSYDLGKPFLPWAFRFAYIEILNHRKNKARSRLVFDSDLLEVIAEERAEADEAIVVKMRVEALHLCLEGLPETDRKIIEARYFNSGSLERNMDGAGMSRRTLFRRIDQIRLTLMNCIRFRMVQEH